MPQLLILLALLVIAGGAFGEPIPTVEANDLFPLSINQPKEQVILALLVIEYFNMDVAQLQAFLHQGACEIPKSLLNRFFFLF